MTLDELYNQNIEESLEIIKQESRSQAKKRLIGGSIYMFFVIALFAILLVWKSGKPVQIIPSCMLFLFFISAGLIVVNNYLFLKGTDSLNTPEQLLDRYEKTLKNNRRAYYLGLLGIIGNITDPYAIIDRDMGWLLIDIIFVVLLLALLVYSYFKGDFVNYKTERDGDITRRLQDLIDMKK